MASGLVFATVGTTKFDDFVSTLTQRETLIQLQNRGFGKLVIQIGNGEVIPKEGNIEGVLISYYRFKASIQDDITKAQLVISHAGAGSCIEVLGQQKPLLVVINEKLMNNHQTEMAYQLEAQGHLIACTPSTLNQTIATMNLRNLVPLQLNDSTKFVDFLDDLMGCKTNE